MRPDILVVLAIAIPTVKGSFVSKSDLFYDVTSVARVAIKALKDEIETFAALSFAYDHPVFTPSGKDNAGAMTLALSSDKNAMSRDISAKIIRRFSVELMYELIASLTERMPKGKWANVYLPYEDGGATRIIFHVGDFCYLALTAREPPRRRFSRPAPSID